MAVIRLACSLPSKAEGLARVSSANKLHWTDIGAAELADVSVDGDAGPVPAQDPTAVGVDLAEGDGSHSSSLEPEGEAADS